MGAMAILVDSSRCTGCKACQSACKSWNGLLPASNPFFQGNEYTHPEKLSAENWSVVSYKNPELVLTRPLWDIVHTHCMHCADAACLKSCPARAVYREDSWVIIDHKRCIGCGVCEKTCPYHAVHVARNPAGPLLKNKAYKCHGCAAEPRKVPACVAACPNHALVYDYRIKLIKQGLSRVKSMKKKFPDAALYGLAEAGGLHVLTVLKQNPVKYNLPQKENMQPSARAQDVRFVYAALSPMALGFDSLRRGIYRIAEALVSRDKS